jgi:hypothetical protein
LVGKNLNAKDQEEVNMACKEANPDLVLAWKMLAIARILVAKIRGNKWRNSIHFMLSLKSI